MEHLNHLPLPYFMINESYEILFMSKKAEQTFLTSDGFLSLVDEGSQKKAVNHITPVKPSASLELILKTIDNPVIPFQLDVNWEGKVAHIICSEKKEEYDEVSGQLTQLRERLAETDFALMEKNEALKDAIDRANQLSGPFIPLNKEVVVIPLFGDLFPEKLSAISNKIVHSLYNTDYHIILFDFTAVSQINQQGIKDLEELFKTIHLMGQETIICGVKPNHAQLINELQWFLQSKKVVSLSQGIQKYLQSSDYKNHPEI